MASGNPWQLYQELESDEQTPVEDSAIRRLSVNKSKSFSHREPKKEHLAERRAISFRVAKKFGQKWLKRARRHFLHEKGDEVCALN